jgi:hypothetical protein
MAAWQGILIMNNWRLSRLSEQIHAVRNIVLSLITALATTGCGAQRGRFVTSGSRGQSLAPVVGTIEIVSGYSNAAGSDEQNLLYIVAVCPGVQRNSTTNISEDSGEDFGKYVTTLDHTWNNSAGSETVTIRWDRQADAVSIGKQEFYREKGNVFVVRAYAGGEAVCQQLESLGPHIGAQGVLQSISNQLPNDRMIATLKLLK